MRVLVTGGAGYIGSHVCQALCDDGCEVVAIDDLSTGHEWLVPGGTQLVKGHLPEATAELEGPFDVVVHCAARTSVEESIREPKPYVVEPIYIADALIRSVERWGTRRIVFSSSAAVYGDSQGFCLEEFSLLAPTNPYALGKVYVEELFRMAARNGGPRVLNLRYFNAAGAERACRRGETHRHETHLIPLAIRAAHLGSLFTLYGTDWGTNDGTAVRDYVHVNDLAMAHVMAVHSDLDGVFNLGTGEGHSVREVIRMVEAVTKKSIHVKGKGRRPGDVAHLVASGKEAKKCLGWRPGYGLREIVETAYAWELARDEGF